MTDSEIGVVPVEYLVEGTVITMDGEERVIREGAVAVDGGRIVAVGKAADLRSRYEAGRTLGGSRHFVIPGMIDCHNHLAQALVRDYALEDLPNIYRIYIPAEMALTRDDARVCAQFGISQLLRSGVTTVAETTFTESHEQAMEETILETGIRAAMARGQGDRVSWLASNYDQVEQKSWLRDDPGLLSEDLAKTEDFLRRWQDSPDGRLRPWINNLGVPSCSEDRFLQTKELAARYGSGMMVHINRDREEIELSIALFGERPIEHLYGIGALSSTFVAIHAMLTTDREIEMLAETGAGVAHAPVVCTDIVSAATKVPTMRASGVTVGLGCDTVINDILKVMRIAFIMHTQESGIRLFDPFTFTTGDAFAMGTIEAARLLSWDHEIGSLEEGKAADVTVVDGNNVRLFPAYDPIGTLVRYATGTDVDSVLVAGRLVVDGGTVLTVDEPALLEEAARVGEKLGEALAHRRYRPMRQTL
ncbi:MAG: amidohydrolase family protein [Actinobacteria bacterium]|nr:amidohydrolase family protein [Actinomycetota bacterium]